MQVSLEVKAQAGGGTMIPITVTGVANVKVSSDPEIRGNAIERFLDQPQEEMQLVARETLEGGLRAVIGKMTPQEMVEDRDKFVATVMNEVSDDFRKLGLGLEEPLAKLLRKYDRHRKNSPVFLQSFEPSSIQRLNRLVDSPLVVLLSGAATRPWDFVEAGDPRTVADLVKPAGLAWIVGSYRLGAR